MRTFGRTYNELNVPTWVEVQTNSSGFNDMVYVTALIQVLKLNLGESPFYANYGIPAKNSIVQQVAPDFYAAAVQKQFNQFFANLIIVANPTPGNPTTPTYSVNITTHQGFKITASIAT